MAASNATQPSPDGHPQVDNLRVLRRLIVRYRPVWGRATVVFCLLIARGALEILYPLSIAMVVDRLVGQEGAGGSLPGGYVVLLLVLAGVIAARAWAFYASVVLAARVGMDVENRLRTDLFRQLMALRFTYHDANRSGATIVRALRDLDKAKRFFREVFFGYLEITLIVLAVLVATLVMHWAYGLVVLCTFGLGIVGCVLTGRRIARMDREVSDIYDGVTTVLQENVAGARVVRAFGREHQESGKFGGRLDSFSGSWSRLERFWTGVMPAINHLFSLALPLLLIVGVWRIAGGTGGIGEVTAVILYCRTVHHRLRPLTRLVIVGQQATASASAMRLSWAALMRTLQQ